VTECFFYLVDYSIEMKVSMLFGFSYLICSEFATTYLADIFWSSTMSIADTYVHARIDTVTKQRASEALNAMGLTLSDAIRLLMLRIVDEHRMPFEIKVPSHSSRIALAEIEAGNIDAFDSVDDLMADLNAEN